MTKLNSDQTEWLKKLQLLNSTNEYGWWLTVSEEELIKLVLVKKFYNSNERTILRGVVRYYKEHRVENRTR